MTYLYAIGDGSGAIKFGVSRNPSERLAQLQTGNPRRLELISKASGLGLDAYDVAKSAEEVLHLRLGEVGLRLVGEWFAPSLTTTIVAELINIDLEAACWHAVEASAAKRRGA